jgi:hypothetical protein
VPSAGFRQLVDCFLTQAPTFDLGQFHSRFVVDKGALGQVFPPIRIPLTVLFHQCFMSFWTSVSCSCQKDKWESLESWNKGVIFRIAGNNAKKKESLLCFKRLILFGILGRVRLYLRHIFKYFDVMRAVELYSIIPLATPSSKHNNGSVKFGWLKSYMSI